MKKKYFEMTPEEYDKVVPWSAGRMANWFNIFRAIQQGSISIQRAEQLGHFKNYPELAFLYKANSSVENNNL